MNEAEWLSSDDALAMLEHLYPLRGLDSTEPQTNKSRLYLLACGRRAWDALPGVCRTIIELAEKVYLNRPADRRLRNEIFPLAEELTHARGEVNWLNDIAGRLFELGHGQPRDAAPDFDIDPEFWSGLAHLAYFPFARTTPHYRRIPERHHSAALVREVYANPFQPEPPLDDSWRTTTVLNLTRHANDSRDFSVLPILADALEEAGCDRPALLDHLRRGGPHVRGCWAVELVGERAD